MWINKQMVVYLHNVIMRQWKWKDYWYTQKNGYNLKSFWCAKEDVCKGTECDYIYVKVWKW